MRLLKEWRGLIHDRLRHTSSCQAVIHAAWFLWSLSLSLSLSLLVTRHPSPVTRHPSHRLYHLCPVDRPLQKGGRAEAW